MKRIYYSPYRTGSVSFQLLLDDALLFVNNRQNNEVLFITCRGELLPCNNNIYNSKLRCKECIIQSKYYEKKYAHPRIKFINLAKLVNIKDTNHKHHYNYSSLDDIKGIEYDKIPIGLGIVSSYVSFTRNINPKLNKYNRTLFENFIESTIYVVKSFKKLIDENIPDEIVLFNGRFSDLRVVFECSIQKQIKVITLEYILTKNNLNVEKVFFVNSLPHDVNYNTKQIKDYWYNNLDENKRKIASEFFIRRKNGEFAGDKVYVSEQNKGLLPTNWDYSKRNFVIFNSSEDEYFSIGGEWDTTKIFRSQIIGIEYIINKLKNHKDINIYLRIHPNLNNLNYSYVKNLEKFSKFKNVYVIKPDSKISSYKLLESCEKCIVFGSTMGVEACYWNKPVILLANSLYINLNVAYYPDSLQELDSLLIQKLQPKPKLGSLMYGLFYMSGNGERYKYVNFNYTTIKIFTKKIHISCSLRIFNTFFSYKFIYFFTRAFDIKYHFFRFVNAKKIREENI